MAVTSVTSSNPSSGAVIGSGDQLIVYGGGIATSTSVFAGGSEVVSNGGIVTSSLIYSGGAETIMAGGYGSYDVIYAGGSATIFGSASNQSIYGTVFVPSGGSVTSQTVYNGGLLFTSQNGAASQITVLSGGTYQIRGTGTVTDVTLYNGGTLDLTGRRWSIGGSVVMEGTDNVIEYTNSMGAPNQLTFGAVISGFDPTESIRFTSLTYNASVLSLTESISGDTTTVTIMSGGVAYESFTFNESDYYGNLTLQAAPGGGTELLTSVACYARGTAILTNDGERAVEDLVIGDLVMTGSGEAKPVKWIGRRSYAGRFLKANRDVLPICIKAGALGDTVPARDLRISPHHAMLVGNVLIEGKDLVNGISVVQDHACREVEYFHVELEDHDVILAEGAWSETFVDDNSRGMFHNAHEYDALYDSDESLAARYYAPRVEFGEELEAVRAMLDVRAKAHFDVLMFVA